MKTGLTFGQTVRAYRLGWRWSERHQALLTISEPENGLVQIDLHPAGLVPNKGMSKSYVCWWESPAMLDACEPLKRIKRVYKHVRFFVDAETGDLIK